jgi:hypothetical protein
MIGMCHDLLEMIELKPWSSWELFPCIFAVTSRLYDAPHILTSSVSTLTGIYSKSSQYFEISGMFGFAPHYLEVENYFSVEMLLLRSCPSQTGWSSLLLVYVYLKLELGGTIHRVSTLCHNHCLVLNGGSSISVPIVQAEERGLHFAEPILWPDIHLLMCPEELQHFQFGGVNFLHLHCVMPRRVIVMFVWDDKILETSSVHANEVNGGGCSLCLGLTDDFLHTILDSSTYENCSGELKKYWDPGGVELQFSEMAFLAWLVMSWDPGGYAWRRLEVKPKFKERGLSATSLLGRHS